MDMIDLPGIGPTRRKTLQEAGIVSLQDLLYRFPTSFKDYTKITPIAKMTKGMQTAFLGEVIGNPRRKYHTKMQVVTVKFVDGTGEITCCWYNQPYLAYKFIQGSTWLLYGVVSERQGVFQVVNPSIDPPNSQHGIQPVYAPIKSMPATTYKEAVRCAIEQCLGTVQEYLPLSFREKHGLVPIEEAIVQAHFPKDEQMLFAARRRLSFEELFFYQLVLMSERTKPRLGVQIVCDLQQLQPLLATFPFALTGAQNKVLAEILADLSSQECMARLVQGDVGSGKTALAFLALYAAFLHGWQGALMAPTEVLARQHYAAAVQQLGPLGVSVGLLIGDLTSKERKLMRGKIASGEVDVVIGTHALITQEVSYKRLGLAITDEQHRFGVRQRSRLSDKGEIRPPNVLVMSATPIPRTLALILYGDLDISIVDELPPGRTPIKTHIVPEKKRESMYGFLEEQIEQGGQVYVVCPLVEESEMLDVVSAEEMYETCKQRFAKYAVGLVHGRMSGKQKEQALALFASGETHILISTTVIEVGVNVPNANVMLIEGADRFGLAQLHQLRGRVGRGHRASYCFLMGESQKLKVLASTNDGFVIAQKDLDTRGPGELMGTRQHGALDGRLAALTNDPLMLQETHDAAKEIMMHVRDQPQANEMVQSAKFRFEQQVKDFDRN